MQQGRQHGQLQGSASAFTRRSLFLRAHLPLSEFSYHPLHHPKATSVLVRTFSKPTWHRGMASALSQVTGGLLALPSRVFLNSVHAPDHGFCSLFQTLGFYVPPHWPVCPLA